MRLRARRGAGAHGPRRPWVRNRGRGVNASGRIGDARAGTRLLRRAGIDVVYFGNVAPPETLDSTRIIVRRGDAQVGERVRAALGVGRVEVQRDSSRLLDASVLLGADFAPPASRSSRLDFHP